MPVPLRVKARLSRREPPGAGAGLRVALYQGEGPVGTLAAVAANLTRMGEVVAAAARYCSQLCVFPEKFNTGYALGLAECRELAEPADGRSVTAACTAARAHGTAVVLPYPERADGRFFDSIAVIDRTGTLVANYRKSHLYGAAERRNYSFGEDLPPVVGLNGMPVGVLNCYECEFPPLYQYLAEAGAAIVVGPTSADHHFPLAGGGVTQVPYQDATRHIIPAMASIWRLFVAYANRRGWEHTPAGSWQYQGNTGLWAPNGDSVITATGDDQAHDTLLIADCDPAAHPPFSPEGNHLHDNRLRVAKALGPAT
ncbi:nitrilase-related carbon-nitrogen hydrolase [Streptomyces sp. NPDC000594]|uniref:nitrilase-related carbon-nitrogen hydrolase n=1 Tax=Streptomyces sp. NPDC000594 TaxID=3154261 RepID=UPI003332A6D2